MGTYMYMGLRPVDYDDDINTSWFGPRGNSILLKIGEI